MANQLQQAGQSVGTIDTRVTQAQQDAAAKAAEVKAANERLSKRLRGDKP